MCREPRCVQHVSLDRVCRPALRFPPQGPLGRVPLFPRYYQSATTSCRPSRRTSFPSLGGTSVALVVFAPRRTSAPPRPGVGHPVSPAGNLPRRRAGSPKFLGNLHCPFARVLTDAGRTAHTRPLRCSSVAPGPPSAEAPTIGLSTLNSTAFGLAVYALQGGLLRPHARLASGCWSGSTGWAFHPQDSGERFQDCVLTSLSSSPKLCLAQWGRPTQVRARLQRRQLAPKNGPFFNASQESKRPSDEFSR
jgi:hypothetical protein